MLVQNVQGHARTCEPGTLRCLLQPHRTSSHFPPALPGAVSLGVFSTLTLGSAPQGRLRCREKTTEKAQFPPIPPRNSFAGSLPL